MKNEEFVSHHDLALRYFQERATMLWGLIERTVTVPGGTLNYISFGKGQRNLIIIQGLNVRDLKGAGASLALMYRKFAGDCRVWFFDRRSVVKNGLTNWDLAEDIYEAMRALGIDAADVFGVSQGGMIAMALALEHPDCVGKLVLGVTSSRANETIKEVVGRWIACAENGDTVTINRETFSLMYTEQYLKKYRLLMPLLVRLIKPKDIGRFAALASAILNFDCYDRLCEIGCPVLVLGGAQDKITTGEASVEIAAKLNCEMHLYPGYGHAAYEEAKDFNDRVYKFLME